MHGRMASRTSLLARERVRTLIATTARRQYLQLSVWRSSSSSLSAGSSNKFLLSRQQWQEHQQQQHRRPLLAAASYHSTRSLSEEAVAVAAAEEEPSTAEEGGAEEDDGEPNVNDIQWAFTPPPPLSEASQQKVDDIFEKILFLDMIEIHLLTEVVQERLGVEGDMGGSDMPTAGGGGGAAAEEAVEEKTLFEVKLVGFDAKAKIKVIKEVRAISGLGLKEAKEMVESAPKILQKDLKPEKAEELKAQLEAVGAQVEIV